MTARPDDTQFAAELRLVLGRINRKLRVRTASGLTPSQSSIIATLAAAGPLHLGELARREAVTAPTASRAVDRLVELELVERMTDPDDARRHTVALTPRGARRPPTAMTPPPAYWPKHYAAARRANREHCNGRYQCYTRSSPT